MSSDFKITYIYFNRNYCSHDEYVNNNDEIMEMMACGSVEHNMYMVVNIGEMVDCKEQEVIVVLFLLEDNGNDFFRLSVCMTTGSIFTTPTWCSTDLESWSQNIGSRIFSSSQFLTCRVSRCSQHSQLTLASHLGRSPALIVCGTNHLT